MLVLVMVFGTVVLGSAEVAAVEPGIADVQILTVVVGASVPIELVARWPGLGRIWRLMCCRLWLMVMLLSLVVT